MNYTQNQTVVSTTYQKALVLLWDIAIEKVSQAIKEIVRENGGIIDLTPNPDEDQDDLFQHSIPMIIPIITSNGRRDLSADEYPDVVYLDLEGVKMLHEWDDLEDCELIPYEELSLDYLFEILNGLADYHD